MTGQHAGPRRERVRSYRVWPRHEAPVAEAPAQTMEAPGPLTAAAIAVAMRARRELTRQADQPTTAIPALRLTALEAPREMIPFAPLTLEAAEFEAMGGHARIARACAHCGAAQPEGEHSWLYDALCKWSCTSCQAEPGWRCPSLPTVRAATVDDDPVRYGLPENVLSYRTRLAAWDRGVRQRPDGTWGVTLPAGGRRRFVCSLASKEDAERVYGSLLAAFAGSGVAA